MPRSKNDKGRFVKSKAVPTSTGYEYSQEFVGPDFIAFDRENKAREGWEPDPTWRTLYELRGKILVIYRRKKA